MFDELTNIGKKIVNYRGYLIISLAALSIISGLLFYVGHLKMKVASTELAMVEQRLSIIKDLNEGNSQEMIRKDYVLEALEDLQDRTDSLSVRYMNDVIYILRNTIETVVDSTGRIRLKF
jgi:hypothetical protein